MASGGVPERAGMQLQVSDPPDEPDGATPTFMGIVNKHARFLNEVSKLQVCLLSSFQISESKRRVTSCVLIKDPGFRCRCELGNIFG
jgi:hypothetical protein